MINQPVTEDFNIYNQLAIKVDNALWELNQTHGPTYQALTQNETPRTTTASGTSPGLMNLLVTTRRAQGLQGPVFESFQCFPVSAEKIQRRRQNIPLMYYELPGHWPSTCPMKNYLQYEAKGIHTIGIKANPRPRPKSNPMWLKLTLGIS